MKFYKLLYVVLLSLIIFPNYAVSQKSALAKEMERMETTFNSYMNQRQHNFDNHRNRLIKEYADYMRNSWQNYNICSAETIPNFPHPVTPIVKYVQTDSANTSVPVVISILPHIENKELPKNSVLEYIPSDETLSAHISHENLDIQKNKISFDFYGIPFVCEYTFGSSGLQLSNIDENSIANAWLKLSSNDYKNLLNKCLEFKDAHRLPDWGFLRLTEKLDECICKNTTKNEARLLQFYILIQSGYKVRIARTDNQIVLLIPSNVNIYQYPYLNVENVRYYVVDNNLKGANYYVFNKEFPNERFFSFEIIQEPILAKYETPTKILTSKRYKELSIPITINKRLIEFYDDYPITDQWDNYVKSSLSSDAKSQIFPFLKSFLDGKSEIEAANVLLNFVQTAFEYKTDKEQFGYERPLFADETLYYPYCDCEDRAIFFSILMRELMGLRTVLVSYPSHLATAVLFNSNVSGDYVMLHGDKYIICDPTYINADVGQSMPIYNQSQIRLLTEG